MTVVDDAPGRPRPVAFDPLSVLRPPKASNESYLRRVAGEEMSTIETLRELAAARKAAEKAAEAAERAEKARAAKEARAAQARAAEEARAAARASELAQRRELRREEELAEESAIDEKIAMHLKGKWCRMARKRLQAHGVSAADIEFYLHTMAGVLAVKHDYERAAAILEDVAGTHGERAS